MAVYVVTGKLGAGKTLSCIDKIKTALFEGRRVATNLDLNLDKLNSSDCTTPVIRMPDKPRIEDLEAIGYGYPADEPYDESRFGDLVLDELGTWMNSRAYRDAERFPVLNWFLHARKYRWNVYLIVQHEEVIDKQLRDSLCEHLVTCSRTDRMRFLRMKLPAGHMAHVYYGSSSQGMKVDTWYYRGKALYPAYDTGQVF
ncbi:MAG: zonular occludens toxin domain-containing protein, partial [Methylophaga sp.]|uniref:zonular occludens toxin domain-containing protein n=1 Tax=Methylophaga sp. TaxID=2024840 RepID=UPI00299E2E52